MLSSFRTRDADRVANLTPGKVVCVGRNYAAHAHELNNPVPDEPVLFIKPTTALVDFESSFSIPAADCHYEAELAIIIAAPLTNASEQQTLAGIGGIALALDLTKRKMQASLKQKSLPWELSKGFDGACPITEVLSPNEFADLQMIEFCLSIDGQRVQEGNSAEMLFKIAPLIAHISNHFTLMPGDIVLTGTPKGVGELKPNMKLELSFANGLSWVSETHC